MTLAGIQLPSVRGRRGKIDRPQMAGAVTLERAQNEGGRLAWRTACLDNSLWAHDSC